jgi:GDPmannose 4,6-dehydratase
MMKKALITGITGQDGALLAKFLLDNGYNVFGSFRANYSDFWRLNELGIKDRLTLLPLKELEFDSFVAECEVDEIYNLAGQSSVARSFKEPFETLESNGILTLKILEAIRRVNPVVRFYQASSLEIFGDCKSFSRDETASVHPKSPYAVSKLFSHWLTVNYREAYGLFACCGILSNHESPYRGEQFVTRKISKAVAAISLGIQDVLEIGNLDVKRDWGFAGDYVVGMYSMLQQKQPDDFVLATGKLHTVRDFVSRAFNAVDFQIKWIGSGLDEVAVNKKTNKIVVKVNKDFFRPVELEHSLGNPLKALNVLGWEAGKDLDEICELMVRRDVERLQLAKK